MSVGIFSISLSLARLTADFKEVYRQYSGGLLHRSINISRDNQNERNPWLSVREGCFTGENKNFKFPLLPSECQSSLTTECVRPGPQQAAECNQCFDFPLVAEHNHRAWHHSAVASPSPADGLVTAKYPGPCSPIRLFLIGWLGVVKLLNSTSCLGGWPGFCSSLLCGWKCRH